MSSENFNEKIIAQLKTATPTVSRARHFALLMLVLIGGVAYLAWHYQHQKIDPLKPVTTNAANITLANKADSFIDDELALIPDIPFLPSPAITPTNNANNNSYAHLLGDLPTIDHLSLNTQQTHYDIPALEAVNDILPPLEMTLPAPTPAAPNNSAPNNRTHKIVDGDSLPDLAQRYYGKMNTENILRIRNANPTLAKGGFRVGVVLAIPDASINNHEKNNATAANKAPVKSMAPTLSTTPQHTPATSNREYIVQAGDTLARIATKLYGRPGAWQEIYNANREILSAPEKLSVGMKLRLPYAPVE